MNNLRVTVTVADIPESERNRRWVALSRLLIPLNEAGPDVGAPDPDAPEANLPQKAPVRVEGTSSDVAGQDRTETNPDAKLPRNGSESEARQF